MCAVQHLHDVLADTRSCLTAGYGRGQKTVLTGQELPAMSQPVSNEHTWPLPLTRATAANIVASMPQLCMLTDSSNSSMEKTGRLRDVAMWQQAMKPDNTLQLLLTVCLCGQPSLQEQYDATVHMNSSCTPGTGRKCSWASSATASRLSSTSTACMKAHSHQSNSAKKALIKIGLLPKQADSVEKAALSIALALWTARPLGCHPTTQA